MADVTASGSESDVEQSGSAPLGTELAGQSSNAAPAEPSVIDLAEDALIRVKGSEKPVKFGEHIRGFQAQATRAAQERARIERELAQERAAKQRYEQQLQQYQRSQQSQQGQPDLFSKLEALPYLTGQDAVEVVKSIGEELRYRDQITLASLKQLQELKQFVNELRETHTNSNFEAKIAKVVSDAGYGPEWQDVASKLYLSYEPGPELDAEFPQLFVDEVARIEKLIDARRTQKLNAARKQPFIPGKGSAAGPSKPLEIPGNASAREVADSLWESMQRGSGT